MGLSGSNEVRADRQSVLRCGASPMKVLAGTVGVIAVLLGGLWLLQGLGIVHLRPILCIADCAAIQGRSLGWAVAGFVVAAAGVAAVVFASRRR